MILLNKHFKKNLVVFRMYIFWEIIQTGWKDGYAKNPQDFHEEKVIFFKYTGKESKYVDEQSFYDNVKVSNDYDDAEYKRDLEMK